MGAGRGGALGDGGARGATAGPTKDPFSGREISGAEHAAMNERDAPRKDRRDAERGGGKSTPDNTPTDNPLDSLFGYETIGQRRAGYAANPNAPGNAAGDEAAIVPSYPMATPGVVAGAMFDALSSMGMLGALSTIGRGIYNAGTGEVSTGFGMDAALAAGGEVGPRGEDKAVGDYGEGGALGGSMSNRRAVAGGAEPGTPTQPTQSQPQQQAAPPVVNPELARILQEQRRQAARRQTVLDGPLSAAATTNKSVLGI